MNAVINCSDFMLYPGADFRKMSGEILKKS